MNAPPDSEKVPSFDDVFPAKVMVHFSDGALNRIFGPFNFTVAQGIFSAFRITGGNNQSGNPGATLPVLLTARTEDAAGNAVATVSVAPSSTETLLPLACVV